VEGQAAGAPRLAATLVEQRDDAFLYRKLATLVDTVPPPRISGGPEVSRRAARASLVGATSSVSLDQDDTQMVAFRPGFKVME